MIEGFLSDWWGQIMALIVVVAWLNRTTAKMDQRLINLEQKMVAIWERYNSLIDKLMSERNKD